MLVRHHTAAHAQRGPAPVSPALDIWWERRLVGQLTQDRHGELGFVYSPDWLARDDAPALSASLPKRGEPYSRRECRPFLRRATARRRPAPDGGRECLASHPATISPFSTGLAEMSPGRWNFCLPEKRRGPPMRTARRGLLDEAGLVNLLDSLPARPLLAGRTGAEALVGRFPNEGAGCAGRRGQWRCPRRGSRRPTS